MTKHDSSFVKHSWHYTFSISLQIFLIFLAEPSQCALEALRILLGVECEVAIVIVNIVGFGLFALLMLMLFIFIKHRYEFSMKMLLK